MLKDEGSPSRKDYKDEQEDIQQIMFKDHRLHGSQR